MEQAAKELKKGREPAPPNPDADETEVDPSVPPASETWVEGQPASDADYGGGDKPGE